MKAGWVEWGVVGVYWNENEGNDDIIISLASGNDVGIVDGMWRVGTVGGGGVWEIG